MELNKQMELFDDGGLKDEGGSIDPVSGNDVPSGSLKKEVRDDIDAKVSEGEFVFPADVVRYWGLDTLMTMRQKAKAGLEKMEMMGQMGNSDEAVLPDDIPFTADDIDFEDDEPMMFNPGGLATSVPSQFANYSQSPQQSNAASYTGIAPVQYLNSTGTSAFNIPTLPQYVPPVVQNPVVTNPLIDYGNQVTTNIPGQTVNFTDLMNHVYREYINKTTGDRIQIRIVNGQPVTPIPEGYELYIPESETDVTTDVDTTTVDETTDTTTTDTTDVGTGDTTDVGTDTDAVTVTSSRKDNDDYEPPQLVKTSTLLNDPRFSDNPDAITLMSNGREVSMPADNYNSLLVSYGRLKDTGAFASLQEYYDLPLGDRLALIPQELKGAFGYEVDAATVQKIVDEAKESGNMGKTGIPIIDGIVGIISNIFGGGKNPVNAAADLKIEKDRIAAEKLAAEKAEAERVAAQQAAAQQAANEQAARDAADRKANLLSAQMAAIEREKQKLKDQGLEDNKAEDIATSNIKQAQAQVATDNQAAYEEAAFGNTSSSNNNDSSSNFVGYTPAENQAAYEEAAGIGASSSSSNKSKSSSSSNKSKSSSSNANSDRNRESSYSYSAPASTSSSVAAGQMAGKGYVGGYGFNEGGLASRPKAKSKTKRNRKKGLGGNS